MTRAFGRRQVFLECQIKVEDDICYKKQIYESLGDIPTGINSRFAERHKKFRILIKLSFITLKIYYRPI